MLRRYYFYYGIVMQNLNKYTRKINSKHFYIKLNRLFVKINLKLKNLNSKLIFIKIFYLNTLIKFFNNFYFSNLNLILI